MDQLTARQTQYVIETGLPFWSSGSGPIAALEMPSSIDNPFDGQMALVRLPKWAADIGVGVPPSILVDKCCIVAGPGAEFECCDWLRAAFLQLSGMPEVIHERKNGPSHSYSNIAGIDPRRFDDAWVNRIFLFLRRWASVEANLEEEAMFGLLPQWQIDITHDVDALEKTARIRCKQTAFHLYNAVKLALNGSVDAAFKRSVRAAKFFLSTPEYDRFDEILDMESEIGATSTFHFYADIKSPHRRFLSRFLMDPAYTPRNPRMAMTMVKLIEGGHSVGIHGSYDSWNHADLLRNERESLAALCGQDIRRVRQHWLRFSWLQTWKAQQQAGLGLDTTLCFNNRPGFRNGCAFRFHPWCHIDQKPLSIKALPTVLMDSHLYDYKNMSSESRESTILEWLNKIKSSHGEASIIWHTHVLAPDYGWQEGYKVLLNAIRELDIKSTSAPERSR